MDIPKEYKSIALGIASGDDIFVVKRRAYQKSNGKTKRLNDSIIYLSLDNILKSTDVTISQISTNISDPRNGYTYILSDYISTVGVGKRRGDKIYLTSPKNVRLVFNGNTIAILLENRSLELYWTGTSWTSQGTNRFSGVHYARSIDPTGVSRGGNTYNIDVTSLSPSTTHDPFPTEPLDVFGIITLSALKDLFYYDTNGDFYHNPSDDTEWTKMTFTDDSEFTGAVEYGYATDVNSIASALPGLHMMVALLDDGKMYYLKYEEILPIANPKFTATPLDPPAGKTYMKVGIVGGGICAIMTDGTLWGYNDPLQNGVMASDDWEQFTDSGGSPIGNCIKFSDKSARHGALGSTTATSAISSNGGAYMMVYYSENADTYPTLVNTDNLGNPLPVMYNVAFCRDSAVRYFMLSVSGDLYFGERNGHNDYGNPSLIGTGYDLNMVLNGDYYQDLYIGLKSVFIKKGNTVEWRDIRNGSLVRRDAYDTYIEKIFASSDLFLSTYQFLAPKV